MVSKSVRDSPDLAPHASVFSKIVTIEAVESFKPHPDVYQHLADQMGVGHSGEEMARMWLVSGNPFDIVGARAVGMQAVWVARGGAEWTDGLFAGSDMGPTAIVGSLEGVVSVVQEKQRL